MFSTVKSASLTHLLHMLGCRRWLFIGCRRGDALASATSSLSQFVDAAVSFSASLCVHWFPGPSVSLRKTLKCDWFHVGLHSVEKQNSLLSVSVCPDFCSLFSTSRCQIN